MLVQPNTATETVDYDCEKATREQVLLRRIGAFEGYDPSDRPDRIEPGQIERAMEFLRDMLDDPDWWGGETEFRKAYLLCEVADSFTHDATRFAAMRLLKAMGVSR